MLRAPPHAPHTPPTQLCKYQEQSQLLDVWLEGIVGPLAGLLRQQAVVLNSEPAAAATAATTAAAPGPAPAHAPPPPSLTPAAAAALARVHSLSRLLNVLVTVRGYKTVVKFFPHEAADLETVVNVVVLLQVGRATLPCVLRQATWRTRARMNACIHAAASSGCIQATRQRTHIRPSTCTPTHAHTACIHARARNRHAPQRQCWY